VAGVGAQDLNMHRAVLEWTPGGMPRSYAEITAGIRSEVARRFNVSWWRGMGFGVVIYLDSPPEGIAACIDDIDGRENSRGTWQWSIIVFRQNRRNTEPSAPPNDRPEGEG